jgi:hypothetical protein
MTLEATFRELATRLDHVGRSFDNLLWAIVQGREAEWSHAVIDHYEAAIEDAIGVLKQASAATQELRGGSAEQFDITRARRALATCQTSFEQAWLGYYGELVIYERKSALYQLRRRGNAWATWVKGVDDALAQCPPLLYATSQALLRCWQDLIEHAGSVSVTAQATSFSGGTIVID